MEPTTNTEEQWRREGEAILKRRYRDLYKKELNLENPQRFSEKLFRRLVMVNRHGNPRFTQLADKFLVREYVRQQVGGDYLVNMIWHGTDPTLIPFDSLPYKCVAKANHGCDFNIVLQRPIDRQKVCTTFDQWLTANFYWAGREYHYYHIEPRILIESYLDDGYPDGPLDYRFWCFGGQPEVIQVDNHQHTINPFYDPSWRKIPLSYRQEANDIEISRPPNLDEMILVASALAENFDFVRVDLYNVHAKTYFGELTFTPGAGFLKLKPETWDVLLGKKWPKSPVS